MNGKILVSCVLFALLTACASGGGEPQLQSAALSGAVIQLDGQTADRSDVQVQVVETGETLVTGPDGRFAFPAVPAGRISLRFRPPGSHLAQGSDDVVILDGVEPGDDIEIRCSLDDGEVVEFSSHSGSRGESSLDLEAKVPGLEGEVDVGDEDSHTEFKFEVEAEHLDPFQNVVILVGGVSIANVTADGSGQVEFELRTDNGDLLPLGATSIADLAGESIEIRDAVTDELLLCGEVPDMPVHHADDDDDDVDLGDPAGTGERGRGMAELTAQVPSVEGDVEIRSRPESGEERFKMEAEHLAPGELVAFLMEDPANPGTFVRIGARAADSEGEAEIDTNDGLPMPFGVGAVMDLVGIEVRVIRDDGSDELLLSGTVPTLIAD